ncbi:MAG: TatD family hydrolase [Chloroflexi bacterium]|nr:TatD family hydrolase [Chloroflexota bacterium]
MRLVDSHAHLQAERFAGDANAVLVEARAHGVERLLNPGWDLASSEAAIALAREHDWVDAAVGIHPHAAGSVVEGTWARMAELARDPVVVAVGETGLDYDRLFSSREAQLAGLRRHIELALEVGKPLVLHCRSGRGERNAQDDLIVELRRAGLDGRPWREPFPDRPPAVLHSFSGPVDYAAASLELGLAVSISGLCFRKQEEPTAEVARLVPEDRLLVETDSPYLPPPGANRNRNEPRWVEVTALWVAERREIHPDALGEQLVTNYERIFRSSR